MYSGTTSDNGDHSYYEFEVGGGCLSDVNNDLVVDVNDISYILFRLGNTGTCVDGDANLDGVIDVNDVSSVLFDFGTLCPHDPPPPPSSLVYVPPATSGEPANGTNHFEDATGNDTAGNTEAALTGASRGGFGEGAAAATPAPAFTGLDVIQAMGFADFEDFNAYAATLSGRGAFEFTAEVYATCLELAD